MTFRLRFVKKIMDCFSLGLRKHVTANTGHCRFTQKLILLNIAENSQAFLSVISISN